MKITAESEYNLNDIVAYKTQEKYVPVKYARITNIGLWVHSTFSDNGTFMYFLDDEKEIQADRILCKVGGHDGELPKSNHNEVEEWTGYENYGQDGSVNGIIGLI